MATLVVIRHCQADGNEEHRFIGHTQSHLTDVGYRQAEALAARLQGVALTRIVASDLARCVETVTPLAQRLGMRVETDVRLREIHNGDWTGFLPEEISGKWPALWDDYVRGADVQRPSGERWADVAARVVPVAETLLAEDGVVLVSTHSGPALIMARWASGSQVAGNVFRGNLGALHNGSVTVLGAGPRLVSFNDVGHLAALPDQRLPFAQVKRP